MKRVEDVRCCLEREYERLSNELAVKECPPAVGAPEASLLGDRSEMAAQAFEMHKRSVLLQHTRDRMAQVEHALEKIAKGTYGLCDSCGEAIPADRLETLPQTNLCTGCKSKRR